ncbi:leucine-rich repeat domain-containing protein [Ruminococcus albus]|uniref:Leucine rich repeat-containing protein n=1 Tax=Ruminococcus albus TaxID=1264 RepID=A0A1I1NG99_RUMAL|nr:leucine-rich repeat domain-containing protein [Ruminococcus albus]SFC93783.1 Leucine rich repeat-containing protein [Ruminococcus albus]
MVEIENGVLLKYEEDGDSYTVPEGVTEIAEHAFFGARDLKTIVFPSSLKKIGDSAFLWAGLKEVHIPASVEEIEDSAFQGCKDLEKVTFENGLRTIGREAFFECKKLTEVILPEGLKTIGDAAFRDCEQLVKAVVSDGTEKLGNGAFLGCIRLKHLELPSTLSEIEPAALANCRSLGTILLNEKSPYYTIVDGMIFDKAMTKLIYCSAQNVSAVIPEGVEEICDYAFFGCSKLEKVQLPESLKHICNYSFRGTKKLNDVFLPDGVDIERDPEFAEDTCIHLNGSRGEMMFYPCESPYNECFILVLGRDYSINFDHKAKYALIFRMYFAGIEGAAEYVKKNFAKMIGMAIENSEVETVRKVLELREMVTKRNVKRLIEKSEYCEPINDLLTEYAQTL